MSFKLLESDLPFNLNLIPLGTIILVVIEIYGQCVIILFIRLGCYIHIASALYFG